MENEYIIEMLNITKEFPGIKANDNITLQLKKGEIHALLGENGAGKSTLMSILFGLYQPTSGIIKKNGQEVHINTPNDANDLNIGMVHQHFKLVECFSVLDNIILGVEPTKGLFLEKKNARAKVMELSEKYGLMVDPDALISDITVGMQQRTEILKMLYRDNEVLIFDEPTAVLTPQEIDELMKIMKNLAKEGKSILFITHKLNEINAKRQETELQIFKAAEELLEQQPERLEDRVILLWGRDWHPGVIGIVASRLVERTGRPVIVVTVDEHGECKGSGRSVQGFNLHACIGACADLLIRYGGHAMAAGLSVREENLEALRRRLNEWAARECPVLQIPPLTCDLSIHLDRVTVDAVRRLDQLAPFGAENPTPVFLLQNAVLDGVYPVSDGKHSRLRLRQGNASLYAVWFGMRPEQLPYATGDVVDTALNLSVYDAPRGAQLSGRIIDLHPAGLGSAMPQQAALVQALRRGTPLTTEQKNLITPARSDIIAVYRELQARRWHAEDLQPLCAKLGEENTGKTLVAVTALEQVGLIAAAEKGGAKVWELVPTAGKKNLADAPILKCLEGM